MLAFGLRPRRTMSSRRAQETCQLSANADWWIAREWEVRLARNDSGEFIATRRSPVSGWTSALAAAASKRRTRGELLEALAAITAEARRLRPGAVLARVSRSYPAALASWTTFRTSSLLPPPFSFTRPGGDPGDGFEIGSARWRWRRRRLGRGGRSWDRWKVK